MRVSAQWMCALDDRIMDHLAARARSSPAAMAAGLGTTAGYHPEGLAAACLVVAYDLTDQERPFMLIDLVEAIEPSVATLRERRQDVRELINQQRFDTVADTRRSRQFEPNKFDP